MSFGGDFGDRTIRKSDDMVASAAQQEQRRQCDSTGARDRQAGARRV